MNKYRENWYYIGGIIFVIIAFALGLFGDMLDPMRRIMIVLFMCLLAHQFEEYAVPGGFPIAWNVGVSGETEVGDRYPLNTQSAFVANICFGYTLYIIGIVFCNVPIVCLVIMYITIIQVFVHGIVINKKLGALYNPGLATALFAMVPIGIYGIWYIVSNYNLPVWNWIVSVVVLPFVAFISIPLPILIFKSRQSPYIFPARDTNGFLIKGKSARIRR